MAIAITQSLHTVPTRMLWNLALVHVKTLWDSCDLCTSLWSYSTFLLRSRISFKKNTKISNPPQPSRILHTTQHFVEKILKIFRTHKQHFHFSIISLKERMATHSYVRHLAYIIISGLKLQRDQRDFCLAGKDPNLAGNTTTEV